MRCAKCGADNREGRKFCTQCGSALAAKCPQCGAPVELAERFCGDCGAALVTTSPPISRLAHEPEIRIAEPAAAESLEGERKTVTALFADIKGSTELEQDLDPEEARAIIDPALKLMIDAAHRYDGYVVQSTGDGIFALFGAPVAHEDHPQRALHAALRMQDGLRRYSTRLREAGNLPIEARIGVNTGEVVVRSIATGQGHTEYTPIGHTTNLASRMQALAPTGSIAVSEQTRKLIEGYFALKPLGPTRVKGLSETVNVYEVTGLGPLRTRLQRAAGLGLSKFVGREREMEALTHSAEQAKAGHGQIVGAMAEAGVGKSRLFLEFKAKNQSGWMVLDAFSVSHGKASAYLPVLDLLQTYFKISPDDDARARREKVNGRVVTLDPALEDTRPYLFTLLGIVDGEDPLTQMDGPTKKRRTLDAIKRILLRESLNQPLMVIFEDLHWIDEQTQEFLNLLADSIANAQILLLVNYRPREYTHQWGSKTYYTQLRLDPLGKESAEEMLGALLGNAPTMTPLKRLIIERTEGNPLFMEETYQALLEEGALVRNGAMHLTKPVAELRIPLTVQGILASRIDRLPADAKDLLQTLSVIGREFPMSLVHAVVPKTGEELDRMLNQLQLGEFIYEQPAVGDTEYVFKHALTQDVAYNSVLQERRKLMHERIGAAIESLYADRIEDHIPSLARHYARSANALRAIEYSTRACHQNSERASYAEAATHFETGLARLQELPDDAHRAELELDLRNAAQFALWTIKGYGSAENETLALRTLELSRRPGVSWLNSWMALSGLYVITLMRSRHRQACELATQMLAIAENSRNVNYTGESLNCLAFAQMFDGSDLDLAGASFERAIALFETMPSSSPDSTWRRDLTHSQAYAVSAWNDCVRGFPDRAVERTDQALALARASGSKAVAEAIHNYAVEVFSIRRDVERTRQHAVATIDLSTEIGNPFRRARGEFHLSWADSFALDREECLARMQRALADQRATGALVANSLWLSLIAQVQCSLGQYHNASAAIDEALSVVEETGERVFESEVFRTKGELLLARDTPDPAEAERAFRTAIGIARRQKARAFELRATTSLARLLRDTKRRDEARTMLAEIYNWFTEGFDTADLRDAKALLDELSA